MLFKAFSNNLPFVIDPLMASELVKGQCNLLSICSNCSIGGGCIAFNNNNKIFPHLGFFNGPLQSFALLCFGIWFQPMGDLHNKLMFGWLPCNLSWTHVHHVGVNYQFTSNKYFKMFLKNACQVFLRFLTSPPSWHM